MSSTLSPAPSKAPEVSVVSLQCDNGFAVNVTVMGFLRAQVFISPDSSTMLVWLPDTGMRTLYSQDEMLAALEEGLRDA